MFLAKYIAISIDKGLPIGVDVVDTTIRRRASKSLSKDPFIGLYRSCFDEKIVTAIRPDIVMSR